MIEYKITYPNLDSNDIGLNLLPQKMIFKFKDNKYRIHSEGGMGLFVTGFISNNEEKKMDYFLKMISAKFVSRFNTKGLKHLHEDFPAYRLDPIDSSRTIAGLHCKGTKVVYYSNVVSDHEIWYTDQIELTEPNWCSPFKNIPGVMMSYQVQRSGLVIRFEADKISQDSIPDSEFRVPLEYKAVSNKKLVRKLEEAFIGFEY